MNYLYIFGSGFLVSLGTMLVLGVRGNRYVGGSFMVGILLSNQLGVNVFIGAILGVLGWLAFVAVTRLTKRAADAASLSLAAKRGDNSRRG
jgi:hypothetical protein